MKYDDDDYDQPNFLKRYGFALGVGAVGLVVVGLVVGQALTGKKAPPRRQEEVVMVRPLPSTPPPPPPKMPEPPKETMEKMLEQTPVDAADEKPDDTPQAPNPGLTTANTGTGGVDMGLGAARGGGGTIGGGNRGTRSRFGWFAAQVQSSVQDALGRNALTDKAAFDSKVRIWADITGRITRVKLQGTTGDKAVDAAIAQALSGLQLKQAPPSDMPMPIVMRLIARRP